MLSACLEGRRHNAFRSILEVCVSADYVRRVAAEFADKGLGAGGAGERVAGRGPARERYQCDIGVRYKVAGNVAPAGNDVDKPVRHAGPAEALGYEERFAHALKGRLDDHRVAHRDCRCELLHQEVRGRVEGREGGDDAVWMTPRETESPGAHRQCIERQDLAVHAQQFFRAQPRKRDRS